MDDLHRKNEEQLNIPADADFTVEDIIREFGSAAEEPPAVEETPIALEVPAEDEVSPAEEVSAVEEIPEVEEPPEKVTEDTVKIWKPKAKQEPEEETPEELEEEEEEETYRPRLWTLPKLEIAPEKPVLYETPEDAAEDYAFRGRKLRLSAIFAWLLMVLSAGVTVMFSNPQWGLAEVLPAFLVNTATLGILLVHSVLALPVLRRGVEDLLHGRFTGKTLVGVTVLITAIRSFLTLTDGTLSLSAPASLLLTVSLWGEYLLLSAKLRTAKTVLAMDEPVAAARVAGVWNEKDCLYREAAADVLSLTGDLERTPRSERVLNAVSTVLAAASLAVAVVLTVKAKRDFLWAWNVLLLGICPLGGLLVYGRAFCLSSRRLKAAGAAVAGWEGAGRLSGSAGVVITDGDLFPAANVSLNGIKIFGDYTPDRLLGYAAAILERSGAKVIAKIFREALEAQNGRHLKLDNFRTYEAGGLGGEVGGDVVLLGGLGFMQTMGISVPDDARLKQALYISVGSETAAVFALNYNPSEAVRSGLAALLGSRGLVPILATRDTLLTPNMVGAKYHLPTDRLEYPVSHERAALTQVDAPGEQGAFLARGSFLSFAAAVRVGRQLRRSVPSGTAVALAGAILGLFLMALLVLIGAYEVAGAMNFLLYHAIWLVPCGLISGMVGK